MAVNSCFYVLKPDETNSDFARIVNYDTEDPNKENINIENGELLLYGSTINELSLGMYKFKTHVLPYEVRDALLKSISNSDLVHVSKQISKMYLEIIPVLSNAISKAFTEIQIFCCIYCHDFCLLSSDMGIDLEAVSNYIDEYLEAYLLIDKSKYNLEKYKSEIDIINNRERIIRCMLSDRQFVKYNPMFSNYIWMNKRLNSVECDSIEKKEELNLFSSLLVKDLVEETHLYWMYESGELRYENAAKNCILSNRNRQYFKYFDMFCEQAKSKNVFHDWVWSLVFLTQTLLASFLGRNTAEYDDEKYSNFFGFVPVFEDIKNKRSELTSHFSHHISRRYCHGFLVVPVDSIQNLPEYFPAYIHEFFHYIPPLNRVQRNTIIFELVLHSLLYDYRTKLPSELYEEVFGIFGESLIRTFSRYNFDPETIFYCDSMEYMERMKSVFDKFNIKSVLNYISDFISEKYANKDYDLIINYIAGKICESFTLKARNYTNTFIFFFREIRSDISMCLLLDIDLKQYIEILAEEPLFAVLNGRDCADSTILRFGYMCRILYEFDKLKEQAVDNRGHNNGNLTDSNAWIFYLKTWLKDGCKLNNSDKWLHDCCDLIDECLNERILKGNFSLIDNYQNLKSYLHEYVLLAIEKEEEQFIHKGESLLENVIQDKAIITNWIESILQYANHPFANEIMNLYKKYTSEIEAEEKLTMLWGMRILFRDLYSYNPNLDLI